MTGKSQQLSLTLIEVAEYEWSGRNMRDEPKERERSKIKEIFEVLIVITEKDVAWSWMYDLLQMELECRISEGQQIGL